MDLPALLGPIRGALYDTFVVFQKHVYHLFNCILPSSLEYYAAH